MPSQHRDADGIFNRTVNHPEVGTLKLQSVYPDHPMYPLKTSIEYKNPAVVFPLTNRSLEFMGTWVGKNKPLDAICGFPSVYPSYFFKSDLQNVYSGKSGFVSKGIFKSDEGDQNVGILRETGKKKFY
jgi:hypothetical protein